MKGHTRKRGKSWAYVVDIGKDPATGKRRQKWGSGFATEKVAAKAMRDLMRALDEGQPVTYSADTVAAYLSDTWLPSMRSQIRPSTWASYDDCLTGRVIPRIGALRLTEVTPRHVADLYVDLLANGSRDKRKGEGLSERTVRYTGRVLTQALGDAVRLGLIPRNPAAQVDRPKARPVEMVTWTTDEARTFLASVEDDRLRALWVLMLSTGMRRGEMLGLKWQDVDLEARRLSIRRALVAVGYKVEWSEPKTAKSRRVVAIDADTVKELRAHRKRQAEERLQIGAGYSDDGLVFAGVDGSPIHPQYVSKRFDRLQELAKVSRIRLHDGRHSAATFLLEAGVPTKVVSERLGHSSTAITSDLYQHVTEHMQDVAAEQAGAAIFGG